jgi:hypothetical protein
MFNFISLKCFYTASMVNINIRHTKLKKNGHFSFLEPPNNDHLWTTATFFKSRGWPLYTGLTVSDFNFVKLTANDKKSAYTFVFLLQWQMNVFTSYLLHNRNDARCDEGCLERWMTEWMNEWPLSFYSTWIAINIQADQNEGDLHEWSKTQFALGFITLCDTDIGHWLTEIVLIPFVHSFLFGGSFSVGKFSIE